jgi:hypothetical protein
MFLDRSPDSFLGEVIGLVRVKRLHIDIRSQGREKVRVEFGYSNPNQALDSNFEMIVHEGRSYGEALRKIREELRVRIGQ